MTEHFLQRITRLDGRLKAFITVCEDRARAEARKARAVLEAGKDLGPLHGIPYAVKDNVATAGVRTTANSRALRGWVPAEDAAAIRRLKAHGAVLLGKLTMNEYGFGGFELSPWARNRGDSRPGCILIGPSSAQLEAPGLFIGERPP